MGAAKTIPSSSAPGSVPGQPRAVDATREAIGSLTPELVIVLCGLIGSPLHETADQIKNALNEFECTTVQIRLSALIRLNAGYVGISIDDTTHYSEIKSLIKVGDELRRELGND